MVEQAYYFINETRREFCHFTNDVSITVNLKMALKNYVGWKETDIIRIGSEDYDKTTCIAYLNDRRYRLSILTSPSLQSRPFLAE
jgi:hypothetical protein